MKEIWRKIPNYENLYEVSSFGRIRSIPRKGTICSMKCLALNKKKNGYVNVILTKNNKKRTFRVHRIVALVFVPNLYNKPQFNHLNGKRDDNRACNLEWCTAKENIQHKFKVLGYKMTPRRPKSIKCVETGEEFISIKEAERFYGKNYGAIQHALSHKTRTAYGLHWKFLNN